MAFGSALTGAIDPNLTDLVSSQGSQPMAAASSSGAPSASGAPGSQAGWYETPKVLDHTEGGEDGGQVWKGGDWYYRDSNGKYFDDLNGNPVDYSGPSGRIQYAGGADTSGMTGAQARALQNQNISGMGGIDNIPHNNQGMLGEYLMSPAFVQMIMAAAAGGTAFAGGGAGIGGPGGFVDKARGLMSFGGNSSTPSGGGAGWTSGYDLPMGGDDGTMYAGLGDPDFNDVNIETPPDVQVTPYDPSKSGASGLGNDITGIPIDEFGNPVNSQTGASPSGSETTTPVVAQSPSALQSNSVSSFSSGAAPSSSGSVGSSGSSFGGGGSSGSPGIPDDGSDLWKKMQMNNGGAAAPAPTGVSKILDKLGIYGPNGIGKNALPILGLAASQAMKPDTNKLADAIKKSGERTGTAADQLLNEGLSGKPSAAAQYQIDQWLNGQVNQINQRYAAMGRDPKNDSAAQKELADAQAQSIAMTDASARALIDQGLRAAGLAQGPEMNAAIAAAQEDQEFAQSVSDMFKALGMMQSSWQGGK